MVHEYTDPTGFVNTFTHLINGEAFQGAAFFLPGKSLNRLINYKFGSVMQGDTRVGRTHDPIAFPNPKRGFIAITTYPPVYQSKDGSGGTQIVVPRKYPPIFVDRRRRNQ